MTSNMAPSGAGQVKLRDLSMEMADVGSGQTLLFLHSGEGLSRAAGLIGSLAKSFRVIAPSHPGFAGSDLPRHLTTVDDLAYVYLDLIDHMGLDDIVLVGCSFGGWLAAEIATKTTAKLSKLVLVDAVGIKTVGREDTDILDVYTAAPDKVSKAKFASPAYAQQDYSDLTEEQALHIARNRESLLFFSWSPYMHNPKLTARLHRIDCPTLVLWGEKDGLVSTDYGRAFAGLIPGARFELIANAGHHPELEQPDAVARQIERFASEQRTKRMDTGQASR